MNTELKAFYEQELKFLLANKQRARRNAKRIEELKEILAERDTITLELKRLGKL